MWIEHQQSTIQPKTSYKLLEATLPKMASMSENNEH